MRLPLLPTRIRLAFREHERWALRKAIRYPLLSIHFHGTLWIWFFVPALPIGFLLSPILFSGSIAGAIFLLILSIPALIGIALISPWYFGWFNSCADLMFGKGTAANRKLQALNQHIEGLSHG